MYTTPATSYYARADDDDGSGLSKQNIIIIAVSSSVGAIFLGYFLYRNIRNCIQRSKSTPHPLPQPLSHHRQQQVAQIEQQLPRATWYEPQFAAGDRLRLDSARGSKASLLGSDSPALVSSITPSIDSPGAPSEDTSHQHLPLPTASYLHNRPSTSSSLTSSDASCPPPPAQDPVGHGGDLAAAIPPPPRPTSIVGRYSPVNTPNRRARPLSMSSTHTYGSTARASRIYGAPHAPHNQIQIILPTPLASANNSRESLAMMRARFGSDAFDRRSMADPWISMPAHLSEYFPSYPDYEKLT